MCTSGRVTSIAMVVIGTVGFGDRVDGRMKMPTSAGRLLTWPGTSAGVSMVTSLSEWQRPASGAREDATWWMVSRTASWSLVLLKHR